MFNFQVGEPWRTFVQVAGARCSRGVPGRRGLSPSAHPGLVRPARAPGCGSRALLRPSQPHSAAGSSWRCSGAPSRTGAAPSGACSRRAAFRAAAAQGRQIPPPHPPAAVPPRPMSLQPRAPRPPHLEHALVLFGADVHSFERQGRRLRPVLRRLHLLGGHGRWAHRWLRERGEREPGTLAGDLGERPGGVRRKAALPTSNLAPGSRTGLSARSPAAAEWGDAEGRARRGPAGDWSYPLRGRGREERRERAAKGREPRTF